MLNPNMLVLVYQGFKEIISKVFSSPIDNKSMHPLQRMSTTLLR